MPGTDWRPTASLAVLQKRAELLWQIRSFFAARGVMEVDTPALGVCGVTDLHIDCIEARVCGDTQYLQSSPEYFMKRLLAAGVGDIFFLGKVYRDGERGRRHRPEFTMLEWYRVGWDELGLIDEIAALVTSLSERALAVQTMTYKEVFESSLAVDPHTIGDDVLAQLAAQHCGGAWESEQRSTLLDLLFSTLVEPALSKGLVFVRDYPVCQAALARIDDNSEGQPVARRFELFLDGVELGNGYFELTDPGEQRRRFDNDLALRAQAGKQRTPVDEVFLAALEDQGLPSCAGVAIGVDRLLMKLLDCDDISQVQAFG